MERVRFITHKGKRILYVDFSNCKSAEAIALLDQARPVFASQPLGSVLALDNVTNTGFSPEGVKALGEFVLHNKPYVRAAALFGATDMLKVILNGTERKSNRSFPIFDTEEEAKDWLVEQ
jgi:hypothetical protein